MFTHDPYQNYSTPGAFTGANPFGIAHPQQLQHLQQQLQQQLQAVQLLAAQAAIQQQLQNPLLGAGYQNPLLNVMQNPYATAGQQNPLLGQIGIQPHTLHPQMGQFGGLQPQSWVGQGGLGIGQQFGPQQFGPQQYGPQQYGPQQYGPQQYGPQQFGGLHPLVAAQLGMRTGQVPGINPWGIPGQGY